MSKITSYTKPYIDALERRVIVGGQVSSNGNLKLINGLGEEIDAGNVQGDIPDRLQDIDDYLNSEEHKKTQVPKSPTMLTELQNEGFYSSSGPMTKITIGWLAPTQDIFDQPVTVSEYQVYINNAPAYRVNEPKVSFELRSGEDVDMYVIGATSYGVWSDPSEIVNITAEKALYEAATPTAPILSSSLGVLAVRWNGLYIEGPGLAQSYVVVHARINSGPDTIVGSMLSSQPMIIPNTSSGDEAEVWFVGFDKLDRETGTSTHEFFDVTGIDLPDLDQAVLDFMNAIDTKANNAQTAANNAQTAANNAQTAANNANDAALDAVGLVGSKGEVIFSNTAPPSEKQLSQNLWIDTTSGNNTPKRWNGTSWVAVTDKAATDAAAAAVTAKDRADAAFTAATNAAIAAGNAQTSANSKNTIWYLPTAPAGTGHKVGDTWFDTDNDNQINKWDGSAWVPNELGTNAIANAAITNAKILDATIQDAKIATLDAAKITTGYLSANRINVNTIEGKHIKGNTISTGKMLITSFENLLQDYSFEYNSTDAWQYASSVNDAVNPRTGLRALKVTTTTGAFVAARQSVRISVSPGERYLVSAWVRLDSGVSATTGITLRMGWATTETGATTASADVATTPVGTGTSYIRIVGEWLVPATAAFATLEIISRDTVAGKIYRVDDVELFKKTSGELIVDGSITGDKIFVDSAFASKITADVVLAGKIKTSYIVDDGSGIKFHSSNGDIVFTADSYTTTQNSISSVADSVNTIVSTVDGVQSNLNAQNELLNNPDNGLVTQVRDVTSNVTGLDDQINNSSNGLVTVVGDSNSGLIKKTNEMDRQLQDQRITFVVTPIALEIRPIDGQNYIQITSEGIYIRQGSSTPSSWVANVFRVNGDLQAKTLVLEEHTIKRYAAGRTVFTENG